MVLAEALHLARARVDGARGLWLVGLDGVIVAGAAEDPQLAEDLLAAAYADLFRRACSAGTEAELARPVELTLSGPSGIVLVRSVGDDLALLALVGVDAIPGRARHQLHLAAGRVRAALSA